MGRNINRRRMSGLLLRGGVWHIDKVIHGTRVCESTGTSDLEEAEALLMRRLQAARATRLFGAREEHTFREAATKYLEENQHKRSLERDARALATLDPYIGELPLQRVHHDTLQPFVRAKRYAEHFKRPCPAGFRSIRVHDLKHTYGHRLRAAGVGFEDRKLLLGHKSNHVTTHYSAPELGALIRASEMVCDLGSRKSPAIAIVKTTADSAK